MLGSVGALWRYPVKSMLGEEIVTAQFAAGGVTGDRSYALVDQADGKVATAKNPRKWPTLFSFGAALNDAHLGGAASLRITLPDGRALSGDRSDIDDVLSKALGRTVRLDAAPPRDATSEEYWPDIEGLEHRDTVTAFGLPAGTFFDSAVVHVVTTATLARLAQAYPPGRFDVRRFRPNVVVETPNDTVDFVENAWVGRELALGDGVRLNIAGPCGRCVMTTLAQTDLPSDIGILRTAARENGASVGVYATVVRGGTARRGDAVTYA